MLPSVLQCRLLSKVEIEIVQYALRTVSGAMEGLSMDFLLEIGIGKFSILYADRLHRSVG
jgi:hypothetical protein